MSMHKRSVRPLRSWSRSHLRARRHRRLQPILESLETRLVLSTLAATIQPTYVVYHPPGTPVIPGQPIEDGEASPPTTAYSPLQLRSAYGINNIVFGGTTGDGTGETIVIVDAYDNPSFVNTGKSGFSTSDLAEFDAYYHLPNPPSFTKVNQSGHTSPLPGTDPAGPGTLNWEVEEALDIEYSHAMAPKANIILVEATDPNDLFIAAQEAAKLGSVVSMSWGNGEFGNETGDDGQFAVPGVTFLASTGDSGAPGGYPAYSPNVVAVGGTSLYLNGTSLYGSEVGWSGSGGGISQFEPEPSYQDGVQSTGQRTIPDVSFDADPNTGVAVYDSYNNVPGGIFGDTGPWEQIGGTSLAAPSWAGLIAIADQGRALAGGTPLTGYNQTLPALYSLTYTDFNDVNTGYNGGFYAHPGYDLVTGLGSPKANVLIPDLAAYGLADQMAVTFQPPPNVIAGDGFGVVVSAEDTFGNLDTSFNGTATLSLTSNPGGSTFSPVTVNFSNGLAVFDGLSLNKPAGGYQFQITSPSFASVTTNSFTVIANPTPNAGTYYPAPTDESLRPAINAADSNGFASNTIILGPAIYRLDNTSLGQLVIQDASASIDGKTLTIEGQGESQTIIEPSTSKGWTDRIFEIVSTRGLSESVVFQAMTISGGFATNGGILGGSDALGGGILIDGGTVSMTSVALTNNVAAGAAGLVGVNGTEGVGGPGTAGGSGGDGRGGGLYLAAGSLTLTSVNVSNNTARAGAGGLGGEGGSGGSYLFTTPSGGLGYNSQYNPLTQAVTGGAGAGGGAGGSAAGGGAYVANGTLVLSNDTFETNQAVGGSGGAGGHGGTGGYASKAGGIGGNGGAGGNGLGGAIYLNQGSLTLTSTDLKDNVAAGGPGGAGGSGGFGGTGLSGTNGTSSSPNGSPGGNGSNGGDAGAGGRGGSGYGGALYIAQTIADGNVVANNSILGMNLAAGGHGGTGGLGGPGGFGGFGGSGANGYAGSSGGSRGSAGGAGGDGGRGGNGGGDGNGGNGGAGGGYGGGAYLAGGSLTLVSSAAKYAVEDNEAVGGSGGRGGWAYYAGDGGPGGNGGIGGPGANATSTSSSGASGGRGGQGSRGGNGGAGAYGGLGGLGGSAGGGGLYVAGGTLKVLQESITGNLAVGGNGGSGGTGGFGGIGGTGGYGGSGGTGGNGAAGTNGSLSFLHGGNGGSGGNGGNAGSGADGGRGGRGGPGGLGGDGGAAMGGGLFIGAGTVTVSNLTITDNLALGGHGGFGAVGGFGAPGGGGGLGGAGGSGGNGGTGGSPGYSSSTYTYTSNGQTFTGTRYFAGTGGNGGAGGQGGLGGNGGNGGAGGNGANAAAGGNGGSAAGGGLYISGGLVSLADVTIGGSTLFGGGSSAGNFARGGTGGSGGFGGFGGTGGNLSSGLSGWGGPGGNGGRGGNVRGRSLSGSVFAGTAGNGGHGGNNGNGGAGGNGGNAGQGANGGNGGSGAGGGLYIAGGNITLVADTVSFNAAGGGFGGPGGTGGLGGNGGFGGGGGYGFGSSTPSGGFFFTGLHRGGNGGSLASVNGITGGVPGLGGTGGNGGSGGTAGSGGSGGSGGNGGNGGSAFGGGLYLSGGSITVYNSTVANNFVLGGESGIGGRGGPGGIAGLPGFGGSAGAGGRSNGGAGATAPSGFSGPSGLPASTTFGYSGSSGFSGSSGSSAGGGLFVSGASVALYNDTVALNGSIGVFQVSGTVNIYNSLFGGNEGLDYVNDGGTANAAQSLFEIAPIGVTESNDIDGVDPLLDPAGLQSNGGPTQTIALEAGSPAIGAGLDGLNGVTLFTDQRGYVPPAGVWDIGAYQFNAVPAAAPTATLNAPNVTVSNATLLNPYTFTITYTSDAAISAASLAGSVVEVTPPSGHGGPITASVVSTVANGHTDPWGDAQSFTVTYSITPPGGSWTSADNGTYTVSLGGSPITDINGTPIPTGTVGTFAVETASISFTRFGLILNHHTGFFSGTIFLENTGSSTFSGPIFVVFNNLTSGAVLENATGTYGGSPYLEINVANVAPGQSVSATVTFNKSLVSYTPDLYLGGLGL